MNNLDHDTLDQADEEILITALSDETLEAAAGAESIGIILPSLTSQAPRGNQCC